MSESSRPAAVPVTPAPREPHVHGPSLLADTLRPLFQTEAWQGADGTAEVAQHLRELGVDVATIWAASRWNMGDDGPWKCGSRGPGATGAAAGRDDSDMGVRLMIGNRSFNES